MVVKRQPWLERVTKKWSEEALAHFDFEVLEEAVDYQGKEFPHEMPGALAALRMIYFTMSREPVLYDDERSLCQAELGRIVSLTESAYLMGLAHGQSIAVQPVCNTENQNELSKS